MNKTQKQFREMKDLALMGGLASTSTGLLTGKNPTDVMSGMLGVGIAGGVANASFNIITKKRRSRK